MICRLRHGGRRFVCSKRGKIRCFSSRRQGRFRITGAACAIRRWFFSSGWLALFPISIERENIAFAAVVARPIRKRFSPFSSGRSGQSGFGRQPGPFENCRSEPHTCLRPRAGLEVSRFVSGRSSRRRRARDAVAARARVITLLLWPIERTGLGSPVVAGSQFGEHAVVLQRCGVAHGLPPGGDVAEQTPHDLTATGFG